MALGSVCFFLFLFYLRPFEWIPGLAVIKPVTLTLLAGLVAVASKPKFFSKETFFETPLQICMWVYYFYIVWYHPDSSWAFFELLPIFFYFLIIQETCDDLNKLKTVLTAWTLMICMIAILGVASEYGVDPLGSYEMTHGWAKGRLVLNNSLFGNPNHFGHSVVPAIMMIYMLLIWKRLIFVKEIAIPLIAICLYCIYLTQSKGAFISGFLTIVVGVTFGRPKFVQILILSIALTSGVSLLYKLPRMDVMHRLRTDEGVGGRMRSFEFGLMILKEQPHGVGWGNFVEANQRFVASRGLEEEAIAAHSTFNQIGTELGFTGLAIFLGLLYLCAKPLVFATGLNVEEERIRRLLFALLVSYVASGWMVDFGRRGTFWMMCGCVVAFERYCRHKEQIGHKEVVVEAAAEGEGNSVPAPPGIPVQAAVSASGGEEAPPPNLMKRILTWRKFGLLDIAIVYVLTRGCVEIWEYILYDF